jgi:hypothetical protein
LEPLFKRILTLIIILLPSASFGSEGFLHYIALEKFNFTDTLEVKSRKYDYLTVGLNAGNNASFFGRNGGLRFPFASLDITYIHTSGIWASSNTVRLFDSDKFVEGVDVSIGWIFDVNKNIDGGISYSNFYSTRENSIFFQSTASTVLNSYLGYDWKYLYTNFGLTYLLGGINDYFFSISNSRYFEANYIFNNYDNLSFEPKLSFIWGTQNFASIYNDRLYNYFLSRYSYEPVKPPSLLSQYDEFKLINLELKLPFRYSYSNYSVEAAYTLSIPLNLIEGDTSKTQSLLSLGFVYYIPVSKERYKVFKFYKSKSN